MIDACLLALAALLWFAGTRQHSGYNDGTWMMYELQRGHVQLPNHPLVLPVLEAWRRLVAPLRLPLPDALTALNVLLGVAAVLVVHRAAVLLGAPRGQAARTCVLFATLPAVVFVTGVVEKYALHLLASGVAFLCLARLIARPGPLRAVQLGVAAGAATLVHAMAALLPCALLPLAFVWLSPIRLPARLGLVTLAAGTQVAFTLLTKLALPAFGIADAAATSSGAFLVYARAQLGSLHLFPLSVWRHWLVPFLPASCAVWIAFLRRGERGTACALAAGLLAFLSASFVVVGDWITHGEYLLPLAAPVACVLARIVAPAAFLVLAALGLSASLWQVRSSDDPARSARYVAGLDRAAGGKAPYLLLGFEPDLEALIYRRPTLEHVFVPDFGGMRAADAPGLLPGLDALIADRTRTGHVVILTAAARRWLEIVQATSDLHAAGTLLRHLNEHYELVPLHELGFAGSRIGARR